MYGIYCLHWDGFGGQCRHILYGIHGVFVYGLGGLCNSTFTPSLPLHDSLPHEHVSNWTNIEQRVGWPGAQDLLP